MSKKISFGSSESYLIYDTVIKQKVIDYLYSNLNLSKHRFIMLNNVNKLEFLRDNEHYISPCFKGFNYLLLFMNLDSKRYCIAIDRRKLSYHKDQIDLKSVFMVKLHVKVNEAIFNGTIFDGKLIESSSFSLKKKDDIAMEGKQNYSSIESSKRFIFLIQDCFYLMGKNILDMEMNSKMSHLDNIFKMHFSESQICDNFIFKLNKLYTYDSIRELIENLIPNCSIPTQGLVFYPKQSGVSVIHIEKRMDKVNIETNQEQKIDAKSYDMIYNFVDFIKTRVYSYEKGTKTRKFWLTKSNIPDVYDLSEKEDDIKLGIAHIPNIKISHLCDSVISENTPVKFNCVYHTKFKKWVPISVC